MGFTLAAALKALGAEAEVVVAELVPGVVEWNRGPLGNAAGNPLADPRTRVSIGDVGELLRREPGGFDAIMLDVDNGPEGLTRRENDWLYSPEGLATAQQALRPDGCSRGRRARIRLTEGYAGSPPSETVTVRAQRPGKGSQALHLAGLLKHGGHNGAGVPRKTGINASCRGRMSNNESGERLSKRLARATACSRREAELYIAGGPGRSMAGSSRSPSSRSSTSESS